MKTKIIPSNDLKSFSLHFDEMTPQEFDSLRILLQTLCKEKKVLDSIDLDSLGLKTLIEKASEISNLAP